MIKIVKIKCEVCGQTLLKAEQIKGEVKCPRCKHINKLEMSTKGRVQRRTGE
nr:MAG TPA: DNA-directed RNA polymerase [Caudoviricetes sp.]DAO60084.1 MAG TPA: DNA-directed RNA polymerase [Caudoviricetes sp.]DAV06714.1 MAG TPA: DNA-directed RNA polymerase [Caudoviricetes sp.]